MAEMKAEREHAFEEAMTRAEAYAMQLHRMIEHIDYITLILKYAWEAGSGKVDLEKQRRFGLFPDQSLTYVMLLDKWGDVVGTTLHYRGQSNFADLPSFQDHRARRTQGLIIDGPMIDPRMTKPVICFSRRLENPDASFDGLAVVCVEPAYLLVFRNDKSLAGGDFISLRFTNGTLLATKTETATGRIYRKDPVFRGESGTLVERGDKFLDNQARIVAWKRISGYPLVAMGAISEKNVLAAFSRNVDEARTTVVATSWLIAAFSLIGMYFAFRYIKRKEQAEEIRNTFRVATEAANEGFYMACPIYARDGTIIDFRFEDCNDQGAKMLDRQKEAVIGATLASILPHPYWEEVIHTYRQAMETGFYEDELRVPPQSPIKAAWLHRRYVRSGNGLAVTLRDISQTKEHEQALSSLANTDALTKLPNRYWLSTFLPAKIQQEQTHAKHFAVLFIDLDNFKNINDTLGHDAGDDLLKEAAVRLKSSVRASDHVARLGGDEFTVVLDQVEATEDVARVARMIVKAMSQPFELLGNAGHRVNASIGISVFPQDGNDGETLLKHADIAMYAAKAAGKGRFQFYDTHLSDTLLLKLSKEHALRHAIERDELVVHYQPRVDTQSGRLLSMEALVRWMSPSHGLIYPHEFIDVAEDNGMILQIGEQVVQKVCAQIAIWKSQGLLVVPVSINVTAAQLKNGGFYAYLSGCLKKYQLDPSMVEVEITEASVVEHSQVVMNELDLLRLLGVKLMIDDFGTGYSSLAQLHRLDVDALKIDPVFTSEIGTGRDGETIFKAIVSMAKTLKIEIVAEGVETPRQLQCLQAMACNQIQGYLISPPVPAKDIPALIRKNQLFPAL
ncbi:EAL domain-containing protein [Oxalobacteraceae bacterium R-40]|uniref:EAL domain-containing protein n=1 Tax=Keguizhuia sedimenti TaxID=3064264 RepID=A0ABU1BSS4_9BURK|nr:EAL domain-containing protein [Oxalobacteraceae bacterium R-40]